jgi:hypothetical protein
MGLKQDILKTIASDPLGFRSLLKDPQVASALSDIGVIPDVLELHAPTENSRKRTGLGRTLCGRNGTRHKAITCKLCLKMQRAQFHQPADVKPP